MYSYGSPHTAAQKQDNQHERTFSTYVRIQVVVLKAYRGRWTIGRSGERGSGISVLPARYDDDDDRIEEFVVLTDHRVKIQESKTGDKYLDLAREPRKLWNVWMMVIPFVIGALGKLPKRSEREQKELEIGGRIETIQITALLRSARIVKRFGDLRRLVFYSVSPERPSAKSGGGDHQLTLVEETSCHSNPSKKPISQYWCEKLYNNNNNRSFFFSIFIFLFLFSSFVYVITLASGINAISVLIGK